MIAVAAAVGLALALMLNQRRIVRLQRALSHTSADLEHLERAFARFAPADVVERLSSGADTIDPEKRVATILFADLVGFTSMTEDLDPAILVPILNGYFERACGAIREHHGHVSRIMGDGLMALFGAIEKNEWQAGDAVRAALAMRDVLAEYNRQLSTEGRPELRFGVGIDRGEVIAAMVGSDELMEFTVMGDVVNVAARVEALTRVHAVDILITAGVRDQLDGVYELAEMPTVEVKGKSAPIATWAVRGQSRLAPT